MSMTRDPRPWLGALVAYYGAWQSVHLFLDAIHFALPCVASPIYRLVGGSMTADPFRSLEASGSVDTVVAAPAGIVFALAYRKSRPRAPSLGVFSLALATCSAYWTCCLHVTLGTFPRDPWSVLPGFGSFLSQSRPSCRPAS
ncbi:MAG: hypothetical protein KatS3mg076_2743 [Candidatus Binatia bacterium]|nr:MAG: hypothetical protein KatS3mg076_2743 [Candidatus Binatia bacterium]